jgi:hypothetical protein
LSAAVAAIVRYPIYTGRPLLLLLLLLRHARQSLTCASIHADGLLHVMLQQPATLT